MKVIEETTQNILEVKKTNPLEKIESIENQINELIEEIYGLNSHERLIISKIASLNN